MGQPRFEIDPQSRPKVCWPLLVLAVGMVAAGLAALALAVSGRFLPHDERFLGATAEDLCARHGCRVVHFMVHDRAAFGGVIVAIGVLYWWLATGPVRRRAGWAWGTLVVSGAVGFASFLAYIGFGYLDVWHAAATLTLLPCYVVGLARTRPAWKTVGGLPALSPCGWAEAAGRACLTAVGLSATVGGTVIMVVGATAVFVPQDLVYLGVSVEELHALNPRLVPLIAHDRAGFGGALASAGVAVALCAWCGRPDKLLWRALAFAGLAGFGPAVGVHFAIGYTDPVHIAPAVGGAAIYAVGLTLTYKPMIGGRPNGSP
jgi:hypothetical protein